jgi:hypothetical protein
MARAQTFTILDPASRNVRSEDWDHAFAIFGLLR